MKRDKFEEMVVEALSAIAEDIVANPSAKNKATATGIGGVRYGEAERKVAGAVARLAASHRRAAKPLVAPCPDMVPPCF